MAENKSLTAAIYVRRINWISVYVCHQREMQEQFSHGAIFVGEKKNMIAALSHLMNDFYYISLHSRRPPPSSRRSSSCPARAYIIAPSVWNERKRQSCCCCWNEQIVSVFPAAATNEFLVQSTGSPFARLIEPSEMRT